MVRLVHFLCFITPKKLKSRCLRNRLVCAQLNIVQHTCSPIGFRFEDQYVPAGEEANPRLASIYRPSFAHLPPALVVIAEHDPLVDSSYGMTSLAVACLVFSLCCMVTGTGTGTCQLHICQMSLFRTATQGRVLDHCS